MSRTKPVALLGFGLVLALSPLALALAKGESTGSGGTPAPPPPPTVTELGGVLSRAGLSGEFLTAAGVSSSECATVVADADTYVQGTQETLASCDQAFASARQAYEALRRTVKTGVASQDDVTACAAAKVSFEQASSDRDAYLDAVFAAATDSLTQAEVQALTNLRANRSWRLDTQYLVSNRSEKDWVALRDALDAKRIATKEGTSVPPNSAALLAQVDAEAAVAAAKVNLDTYKAAVQTSWNSAVSE